MPLYETNSDLLQENLIMLEFLCYLNQGRDYYFSAVKVPLGEPGEFRPDFRIIVEKTRRVVGYAEIRRRNQTWGQIKSWGGQYMDKDKWHMLVKLTEKFPSVALVSRFSDCLGFYNVAKTTVFEGGTRGRTDRNDPDDVAPSYLIDPNAFIIVEDYERKPNPETNPAGLL